MINKRSQTRIILGKVLNHYALLASPRRRMEDHINKGNCCAGLRKEKVVHVSDGIINTVLSKVLSAENCLGNILNTCIEFVPCYIKVVFRDFKNLTGLM